jgi:uncharacterized phage-associated protein
MKKRTAKEISLEIVVRLRRMYPEKALSTTVLQKLLYYCQAWSMQIEGNPLFEDDFEAWSKGPVIRNVWIEFKNNEKERVNFAMDTCLASNIIDSVCEVYGNLDREELSDMTHDEDPWLNARIKGKREVIKKKDIIKYFKSKIVQDSNEFSEIHNKFIYTVNQKNNKKFHPVSLGGINYSKTKSPQELCDSFSVLIKE